MSVLNYFPKLLKWGVGGNTIVIIGQDYAIQFSFKNSNGSLKVHSHLVLGTLRLSPLTSRYPLS
jgi:hypothetical protein